MSDGTSTRYRRITRTDFRPCSTCKSHSQAPLYSCALRTIADRAEGTFARLRYILGGDRPSQTTRLTLFPDLIQGRGLEAKRNKGGIPRATPRGLAPSLQSLPPILYMIRLASISSYSKGPRGLSVPMRVTSVFTGIATSPGPGRGQRSDRYAIRAGRNLPDKEFRYLRTVIVTAAVYRGFDQKLRSKANLFT